MAFSIATYTKFAIFDSEARMVLNRASKSTAVSPIGFDNFAFSAEVNLSTISTVGWSSGLGYWVSPEVWYNYSKGVTYISFVISLRTISKFQPGSEPSLLFLRASMYESCLKSQPDLIT